MTEWILILAVIGCAECETYRITGFPTQDDCLYFSGKMNADPRLQARCNPDGPWPPPPPPEPKAAPAEVAPSKPKPKISYPRYAPRAYQPYRPAGDDPNWPRMR